MKREEDYVIILANEKRGRECGGFGQWKEKKIMWLFWPMKREEEYVGVLAN